MFLNFTKRSVFKLSMEPSPLRNDQPGSSELDDGSHIYIYIYVISVISHRIHVWDINPHLVDFYGTCR